MRRKSLMALLLAGVLSCSMTAGVLVHAETTDNAADASESSVDERLESLAGTYTELFPVIGAEENKQIWIDALEAYTTDTDEIEQYYQMLLGSCTKEIYGQEAIDAYSDTPEDAGFDCYFLDDMAEMTIDGNTISGVDKDGNELFSHTYHYVEDQTVIYMGQELGSSYHIYECDDPDSGDFTYFAFADDTPADTYHLEFRYGASSEDIANFTEGAYAYWNAAAFMKDYDDQELKDVIQLFVDENVGSGEEEATEDETATEETVEDETVAE